MDESIHKSVLLPETVEGLNLPKGAIVIDGTLGGGGHSAEICRRYGGVKIIAIDKDKSAWKRSKDKFKGCDVRFHAEDFRNLDEVLKKEKVGNVDGIMLDLGLSSDELENSGRGFSFQRDEPLLMTMKEDPKPEDLTAYEVVNSWDESNLSDIIYGYGEERYARRIARAIVEARSEKDIETTFDLVKIVESAVPASYRRGKINPATKTFQAIRIVVNDELGSLTEGLSAGFEALKSRGRIVVISFHSLEDRIVKKFFKEMASDRRGILINKKPIVAGEEEIRANPRSRSAKLRILEKI